MKRKIAVILCITLMMCALPVFALTFSDLTNAHWAYENIMGLVEKGVINGYQDGTYRPENDVTRGEFFKLIVTSVEDEEYIESFYGFMKPLLPHWASMYALYIADEGCMMAEKTVTDLDTSISRLEMAVTIAKIAMKNNLRNIEEDYYPEKLTDLTELSEENRLYVEYVVELGIIKGYEDKTFRPNQNMTRAEVATVISRVLERK